MSDLMIKMAQTAVEDEMLYASYIHRYALKEGISWAQVAERFQIDVTQLAKLALCRLPQPSMLAGELMQVADYVGMERSSLREFLDKVEERPSVATSKPNKVPVQSHQSSQNLINIKKGVMAMFSNRRIWAVGAIIIVLLMGAFVLAQSDNAPATLVVFTGEATIIQVNAGVLASGQREVIVEAAEVVTVGTGDTITMAANSSGQIRLIDGSTIDLAANTSVDVTEIVITDSSYRVHLQMLAGRTVSRVVHVLGVGERFEISTPSSTASVRGTVFTVEVVSATETFVACDEGVVQVAMGNEDVEVGAGMMVTTVVGQPLQVQPQEDEAADNENVEENPVSGEPTATSTSTATSTLTPTATTVATATASITATTTLPLPTNTLIPPTATLSLPTATPEPAQVTICHVPPGNLEQAYTIVVGLPALQAHLDHGDTLGPCPEPTDTPPPPPTNTPPPLPTDTPPPPPTNTPPPLPTDTPPPSLVTICHIPAGNPGAAQTIMVPPEDVQAHLDHGDTLGACP